MGDNTDDDDDGDGVPDGEDLFPLDENETVDFDGDGIGDNSDSDDDGMVPPMTWTVSPSMPTFIRPRRNSVTTWMTTATTSST